MKRLVAFLFVLCFVSFLFSDSFREKFPDRTQQTNPETVDLLSFDSANDKHWKEVIPHASGKYTWCDISFNLCVYNIVQYDNVFQTASLNNGVRFELNRVNEKEYSGGVLLGLHHDGSLRGFALNRNFNFNSVYKFRILCESDVVKIFVDDDLILAKKDEKLSFDVSLIRAGAGFNNDRALHGAVKNFSLRYNGLDIPATYGTISCINKIFLVLSVLFMVVFFVFLWFGTRNKDEVQTDRVSIKKSERSFYRKNDLLLILRAFACFLVLSAHVLGTLGASNWGSIFFIGKINLSWIFYSPAWVGMWIFFVLSGYLMGKSFYSRRYSLTLAGVRNFYVNRLIRIVPLYLIALFIVVFFQHVEYLNASNANVFSHLLTFTYNGKLQVNPIGALWSISTEMQYYLLVPFIFCVLHYRGAPNRKVLVFLLVVIVCHGVLMRFSFFESNKHDFIAWLKYVYTPFVSNADLFIGGFLLAGLLSSSSELLVKLIGRLYRFIPVMLVGALVAVYFGAAKILYTGFIDQDQHYINFVSEFMPSLILCFTALIIVVVECRKVFEKEHQVKKQNSIVKDSVLTAFEYLGILTYGIYVWHTPVIEQIVKLFPIGDSFSTLIVRWVLTVVISVGLSIFTYYFIEKPLESKKLFSN